MLLCRVVGPVVATHKDPALQGHRLLLVQPLTLRLEFLGPALIALDRAEAGDGDLVLVNKEGGGARILFQNQHLFVQAVIVGVVDGLDLDPTLAKLPAPRSA